MAMTIEEKKARTEERRAARREIQRLERIQKEKAGQVWDSVTLEYKKAA